MKINKTNLAFFISTTCAFTLNMAMEAPKKEPISLEVALNNQANLANMPNEIKVKIINDLVQNIIDSNNSLPVIDIIKSIAKGLLPLRQIDREFNELINDYYISHGLSRMLKSNGIDINQKTANGNTALISSIRERKLELAKLIIALGANVNEKNNDRDTALMYPAINGHISVVQLLIGNSANVNEKGICGNTVLMLTAITGHKDIVELLIGDGANVNEKNNAGYTALMFAASNGHKGIVELLIDNGANVSEKNNAGYTALMFAVMYGYKDIVELLEVAKNKENRNN